MAQRIKIGLLCSLAICLASVVLVKPAQAAPVRYTATSQVQNIILGSPIPNCSASTLNPYGIFVGGSCLIKITATADSSTVTSFLTPCASPCNLQKGEAGSGFWNLSLQDPIVEIYDPISGTTYGPAALPPGFFVSFDAWNGGIGFGSNGTGGPAYPVSAAFGGCGSAFCYSEMSSSYMMKAPILVGGFLDNCPAGGGCSTSPPVGIPVTLPDGSVASLSVPGNYYPTSPPGAYEGMTHFWTDDLTLPAWVSVAPMLEVRTGHTATTLLTGKVLVVGGSGQAASSAEEYDPTANSWSYTAPPLCARTAHVAALLNDGRIFVAGGQNCPSSAEIFDPVANAWIATAAPPGSLAQPVMATQLPNADILVGSVSGAYLYDPASNTWTDTNGYQSPSGSAVAVALGGGKVSMFSGVCTFLGAYNNGGATTAQTFDSSTNTWTASAQPNSCSVSGLSANLLPNNLVLVTGLTYGGNNAQPAGWWALYDPVSASWRVTSSGFNSNDSDLPFSGGTRSTSTLDGKVILTGGMADVLAEIPPAIPAYPPGHATVNLPALLTAVFDSSTNTWAPRAPLLSGRTGHATATLNSGEILVLGGTAVAPGGAILSSVEKLGLTNQSQTISFSPIPALTVGQTVNLVATATSGLAVSFASSTPTLCTVSGATLTGTGTGTCQVTATQAGNQQFTAASAVTQTTVVGKGTQTISFAAPASIPYLGSATISVASSSGLPVATMSLTPQVCSITGGNILTVAGGACQISATQSGNQNFLPASPVIINIMITPIGQTISFGAAPSLRLGGSATISVSSTSSLPVVLATSTPSVCSVAGLVVSDITSGNCTLVATQRGNSSYLPAQAVSETIAVQKRSQTIDFPQPHKHAIHEGTVRLHATASSGLPVTFVSKTPRTCEVRRDLLIELVDKGECEVAAVQAGDSKYLPAPEVVRTLNIVDD